MINKLEDSNTALKAYWIILNRLFYNKKIPTIPPLLADVNFVSDFYEEANLFNSSFASAYTPKKKASILHLFRVEQTPE